MFWFHLNVAVQYCTQLAKHCDFKMTEAGASKGKDLSLSDKILVIGELDKKTSHIAFAKKSQLSPILKSKEKLLTAHRKPIA